MRALLIWVAMIGGCDFDVWVEPASPPIVDPPLPQRLEGEAPALLETEFEGIQIAANHPELYYVQAEDLWYRYWRKQWYQAFNWDGNWFPPERVPKQLRAGPIPTSPP